MEEPRLGVERSTGLTYRVFRLRLVGYCADLSGGREGSQEVEGGLKC